MDKTESVKKEQAEANPIVRCKSCKWWQTAKNRYNGCIDPDVSPITGDDWKTDEEKDMFFPHEVRYCEHPKVLFYQRPASDGVAVFDGSEYCAYIATGENYGCVNHELLDS